MKRSLVLVPFLLLVLLNACVTNAEINWDNVWGTLTATYAPPTFTPSPTVRPDGQWLVTTLNQVGSEYSGPSDYFLYTGAGGQVTVTGLAANLDQLEDVIGADFMVLDVQFPTMPSGANVAFQVHARCECATNGPCCTPEHMFVLTIRKMYIAMQQYQEQAYMNMGRVPQPVEELQVVAYDHQRQVATMVAPWAAVQSFIRGEINGYQLGLQVFRR